MIKRPVLFYIFSRNGPPRDEYLEAREEPLKPYGSYNDAGFTVEQPPLPSFMQQWTRYDVSLTEEAFEAYWSDITLPEDLLEGLPDFICLAGHLMVSERARTVLNEHAPCCITWVPIQLVGKESGRAAPGGHQLLFPRISIGYPDSGKPRGLLHGNVRGLCCFPGGIPPEATQPAWDLSQPAAGRLATARPGGYHVTRPAAVR